MKIKQVELTDTVFIKSKLHLNEKLEVAFAGRSNVGKSSLLNKIFNKTIAKTSSKPGKTRSINYYLVNQKYYFVDLPGYGYAVGPQSEKDKWEILMSEYFELSTTLQTVFLLLDHRHKPKDLDHQMIQWLKSMDIPFSIILTKEDKLKTNEKNKMFAQIKSELSQYGQFMYFPVSTLKNTGIDSLSNYIGNIFGEI